MNRHVDHRSGSRIDSTRTVGGPDYGDNMTDAHTRIDSLKEDIREIGFSVLDLQAKVAAHDSKLEQILATQLAHGSRSDQIDVRLKHIDIRLDGLETRFDGLETRFDGLETRFDGLETRFDRRFADQDNRFDRVDALLAEVLSRLPQPPQ